ncbi:substrate-binding periplasmic protein [Roseateles albus]|uniref:Transporter substrate-binding domain-containing protein n=1 Tax=Roseateles albus TaxID=2987525 RepID=A0ABT5KG25_9BURK|nr:transporter substrate-binding domain-containing protein [Roseateles albus]MDC8772853.1 transporter substrate-binding domain-containing protein [Roseateles albus]
MSLRPQASSARTISRRTVLVEAGLCALAVGAPIIGSAAPQQPQPQPQAPTELVLRVPDPHDYEPGAVGSFYVNALLLALSKTAKGKESVRLSHFPGGVPRARLRLMLERGEIDLLWSSSTAQRESAFEPVRFNLLKGINEQRFLLIRKQDAAKLSQVQSLEHLREFRVGAGEHWSDASILRTNGFQVVTATSHDGLFKMLAAGRFDFIARAINEIEADLLQHPELDLAVVDGLLLQYKQPIYFFLTKGNVALAERIRQGLEMAKADGSFDKLFFTVPALKSSWDTLSKSKTRVFKLQAHEG